MNSCCLNFIPDSRNWCHEQWTALAKCDDSICMKVARAITAPLLAIATIFAEILYFASWCMCKKERSPEEQYGQLVRLHLPIDQNHFTQARKHPSRNRFSNILPNEPTRFKIAGEPDFYFNANWVLGKKAIACQGPLESEIDQFRKMIWEGEVSAIVMLANPIEKERNKCSEYWKDPTLGELQSEKVVFKEEGVQIVERKIEISNGSATKVITQFHLQNWPDFGVVSPQILARIVRLAAKKGGKLLVHCSAGVGRTGTFLAAFQAYHQKTDDIFPIVRSLRDPHKGRVGLIQTPQQFALASNAAKILIT